MNDPTLQTMLTLAALAYRGFQDVLPGEPHEAIVRHALRDGLDGVNALAPVKGHWELVWGPETSRVPLGVFDSSAMYVVRHKRDRQRYVAAIRGTNPVASTDWLFGDFWVGQTVPWPYASDGAAISMSTALGLASLQAMRSRPLSTVGEVADKALSSRLVTDALGKLSQAGRAALSGTTVTHVAHPSSLEAQVERIVTTWLTHGTQRDVLAKALTQADNPLRVESSRLRPKWRPAQDRADGLDLLSFLKDEVDKAKGAPLEVIVTGHSKGGALAPAVALWLRDALDSSDPQERWGDKSSIQVSSYAFAGPTPGNEGFAGRIDTVLGSGHHHLRNMHDLVTHAWQVDELQKLPALYGTRSAVFGALLPDLLRTVAPLNYRHAKSGVVTFEGRLDDNRLFVPEFIHQHLDAYLDHLGLLGQGINAVTFFI